MESKLYFIFIIIALFNFACMMICLGSIHLVRKEKEKIKDLSDEKKGPTLSKNELMHFANATSEPARLRITRKRDIEFLTMMALKHSEITLGRATELLGISYNEAMDLHGQWRKNNYKFAIEEELEKLI